ncbi:MAG: EAL domain-containing protein, partial [Micromonosporaceae bacterium]|nr:EAL domain-containing protein [Micromonosporaceae bacterium]
MVEGPTIGVLTMSVGCEYFGGILGGIARTTAAEGGRMIVIQTLGAGTFDFDPPEPPDFRHPIAWDHVSAFIVILNSASLAYLQAIRRAGKPVIMISDDMAGFPCPVVLPDNRSGVREAVLHLVGHGHRDIAFAGYLELHDLRERYEAYRDALLECGITPRADLCYDTGDNRETGGDRAARAMIAAGLPSTAVLTGNDLNAIGLMRTLQEAGVDLPRKQAIVGFDDMDGVVYLTPSLSTVRQSFESLGQLAATLALRAIAGEEVEPRRWQVPTSFQARESCGCPDTLALGARSATSAPATSADQLVAQVAAALSPDRIDAASQAVIQKCVEVVAGALQAAADDACGPSQIGVRQALVQLQALTGRYPEALGRLMRCVRQFGLNLAQCMSIQDTAAGERLRSATEDIVVALAQSPSRTRPVEENEFLTTLKMLYTVSKNLLSSHEKEPRALAWIEDTNARGGCLGLWSRTAGSGPGTEPGLDPVTMFERGRGLVPVRRPGPVSLQSFPPADLVELADLNADQMVYVAPLKLGTSDWGMLALVGPIEADVATGREMMNQWAALLTISLEHEAVLKSLRKQEELLRHAALYDPLTGLANRTLFLTKLEQALDSQEQHPDRHWSVLLLDLDGFKLVNDSMGHLAGDRLLILVAERIRASAPEADVAARFGGDEFAILISDPPDGHGPVAVAQRIRAALDDPFRLGEEEVVVSASIGISLSTTGYRHAEDVIRDADTAMYSAKWQRKGSHAVFDVGMHARVVGRLRTEAELRRALETDAFEMHYQPIVRLDDGVTCAFEALIRWRHPVRGLVGPNDFLPIAEESGLMPPIGRWVLTESCRQVSAWRAAGYGPEQLRISVNVSNRQFWHTRLLNDIQDSLRETRLDPSALIIEITEGVIVNDVQAAHRRLAALHDMGVQVHIDDFGTGYSSLEALHRMTIDAFKIDRSFVTPLDGGGKSRELVRSIVSMGVNLG